MAIEVHAGFHPQGVAGTKAARGDAGSEQVLPQGGSICGRQHDFQTVFAGVAGAGDKPAVRAVGAAWQALENGERLHQTGTGGTGSAELADGTGALHCQHGQFRAFGQGDVKRSGLRLHPGQILVAGGGVHHHAVAPGGQVDDQVVDHAAGRVEHAGVQGLAQRCQLGDIVGDQATQVGLGIRSGQVDHGHVGNVEHAGVRADDFMFLELGTVMNGHVPATERHHFGASGKMQGVEGGLGKG